MKKYPWFKHYNNDDSEPGLVRLWDEQDYEAIAFYIKIRQLMSRFEAHDARGKLTLSWSTIARETRMKPSKARRVLARISAVSLVRTEHETSEECAFLLPNWLESQEIRDRKTSDKPIKNHSRSKKREVRRENIEEELAPALRLALSPSATTLIGSLKKKATVQSWQKEYSAKFLGEEINAAAVWLDETGESRPNTASFLTGWFKRSNNPNKSAPVQHSLPKSEDGENVTW